MNPELDPNDERAIEVLLAEIHGKPAPDLSREILSQLKAAPMALDSDTQSKSDLDSKSNIDSNENIVLRDPASRTSGELPIGAIVTIFAVIAASVVLVVFFAKDNDERVASPDPKSAPTTAIVETYTHDQDAIDRALDLNADESLANGPQLELLHPDGNPSAKAPTASPKSPRPMGVPMIVKDTPPASTDDIKPQLTRDVPTSLPEIDVVATAVEKDLKSYWKAIGIGASDELSEAETLSRLQDRVGIKLSAFKGIKSRDIRSELVTPQGSAEIASRWLDQMTEGGLGRLETQVRESLIAKVSQGVAGKKPFGEVFAGLLSGQSEQSSAFYSAAAGDGHDALVRRVASVSMNVDLRCTQCHDALIEGSGQQNSYWSFSSFMRRGLRQSRSGDWSTVSVDQIKSKSAFYELLDGRQRAVQPGIDPNWLDSASENDMADIRGWAQQLETSRELAGGLVNSLWQFVHGRSLRGSVVDTVSAPHDATLQRLQDRLTDDLLQSNFDVARTLAIIIASPVTTRSVPAALQTKNALTASDTEIREAMNHVNAFAAALPVHTNLNLRRRLEIVMKSTGGRLGDLDGADALLANIATTQRSGKPKSPKIKKPEVTGFPYKTTGLPVQWLSTIKTYQSRVDHLGYLAGKDELPKPIQQAALELKRSGSDQELALARVWWLLQ